ncbi:cold shock domain-containing protein [Streptomyces sp. NBC_00723]
MPQDGGAPDVFAHCSKGSGNGYREPPGAAPRGSRVGWHYRRGVEQLGSSLGS